MKDARMHTSRNSLDPGIETVEAREPPGIGMAAVRGLVARPSRERGADVAIEFTGDGSASQRPFELAFRLPSDAVIAREGRARAAGVALRFALRVASVHVYATWSQRSSRRPAAKPRCGLPRSPTSTV
jgi:hypothetical protein